MKHKILKNKVVFSTLFCYFICSTLCQSTNVNSKGSSNNKRLNSNGLALKDDGEDDKLDDYYSKEYGRPSGGDLLNSEYENGEELDKFQSNSLPLFLQEPEDDYIVKSKAVTLKCKTANALKVTFKCSGNAEPPVTSELHVDPQTGTHLLESSAIISRDLVEEFFSAPFLCECSAWSSQGGEIKSRPASITIAYLKKNFAIQPLSARIEPGTRLEIKCTPPPAKPQSQMTWLKNGEELPMSTAVTITKDGSLLIHSAKVQDTANYTCQAENIVGKRLSDPVPVVIRNERKWSEWSVCSQDCIKFRRRNCNPKVQEDCYGKDIETAECREGDCQSKIQQDNSSSSSSSSSDRIVYISLIVVSVLCVVLAVLFANSKRRKPEIPDYIVTDEILEIQPKNYEGSEKRFRQQLEPSKKSSYTYEYNTMAPDYGHQVSFPHHQALYENHYHEPQLAITYSVPIDQRSPLEKLNKVANTNTSYGSRKLQSDTISSSTESLNSTQVIEIESSSTSLMNEKQQPKSNMIEQMVTSNGGWLELEHLETSLSIPELTFERTRKYNIFLTVLHNEFIKNQITCNFNDNSTHLSSIIYCGPSEVLLNKPVILKFPHCASHFENWTISLLHNKCANDNQKAYIDMDDEKDKWTRIASTNNDVVNPQAFIQLDTKNAFIISRVLGKLLLVGESKAIEQGVDKRMKIALFGPKHKMPAGDFNIRIYIVEDYPSSINYCTIIEKNLGNDLLVESKDFLFKNNKEDLFVQLVCSGGWQTRNESQKIPYSHVWKNSYLIHCDFLLEKCNNNVNKLNMEIFVKQKHGNDIFLNNLLFYS